MANSTATTNLMVNAYIASALYGALTSTVPTTSAGTELSFTGSPAYARILISRGTTTAGSNTATAQVFNVASGQSVAGYQEMSAATAGTYYSGGAVTSFTASGQATYTVTATMAVA